MFGTPSSPKPPRKRLVGCLVKGPLGCAAFLIGAVTIFILFLPALALAGRRRLAPLQLLQLGALVGVYHLYYYLYHYYHLYHSHLWQSNPSYAFY